MMKNSTMTACLLAAGLLFTAPSCGKQEPLEETDATPIVFGAETPEILLDAESKATSGATEVTSLSSFKVTCVTGAAGAESVRWENQSFSGSSSFTCSGRYWPHVQPTGNDTFKFYATNASANLSFAAAGTSVNATNNQDVVCAYLSSSTWKGTAAQNKLTFGHIFGRLGSVKVTAASGYTLSNVSVTITPNTSGTYNLRTGTWSSMSNTSYTVASATSIASGANATTDNNIYVIPGSYTIRATWTATMGDYTHTFSAVASKAAIPFTAGKVTTLNMTLGGSATQIAFSYSITAWDTSSAATSVEFTY